jgi:hypothetical protein
MHKGLLSNGKIYRMLFSVIKIIFQNLFATLSDFL